MPVKIAFFSDNFYPELSGITDTILITGGELKKRGHEIVYVSPRYVKANFDLAKRPYPATFADDLAEGMQVVRLPSVHLPFSPTGQSRFAFPTSVHGYLDTFKPDIIHTQSPYSTGWSAVRAARRYKIPLVGTNHTAIEDFISPEWLMRRFDAWYYNHCDFVSAPYQKLVERMREAGFKKPGHAVRNPAELSAFSAPTLEQKAERKKELGLPGPVILYCGRVAVEKRVDVVIRGVPLLLEQFPTLTFVITGHGADVPRLKTLAQRLGISEHVRFTGFLPRHELAAIYQATDVFAFMSTSDSQSIALMQAYASGTPAVCARARGLPDYTPKECGFLVEPGDSKTMAEKIALLLNDSTLYAQMSADSVRYASTFSPQEIATEWEEIYQSTLHS